MERINDLTFNPDYSSISISTSEGHRIFNCEPFGEFYSSTQGTSRRSISNSIEETTTLHRIGSRSSNDDIRSPSQNNNDTNVFPTVFLKMLFSTSLTIIVPQDNAGNNRLLKIYNLKQNLKICELTFPSNIIDIKLNRKRLLVVLETGQIYIYDLSCVRLLKILQINPISVNDENHDEFVGELSVDDRSWLVIPISQLGTNTNLFGADYKFSSSESMDTPGNNPKSTNIQSYFDSMIEFTKKTSTSSLRNKSNITLDDIKHDSNGWVLVYDTLDLKPILIFQAHDSSIAKIAISNNSENKIATASKKGTIVRVFQLKESTEDNNGKKFQVKQVTNLRRGHNLARINSLSFHNDNQVLGCGSESDTIHIFKLSDDRNTAQTNNENNEDNGENEDSDMETSRSSDDLNESLAGLLLSKPVDSPSTSPKNESKNQSSWLKKTKKFLKNNYTNKIIKKLPYKDYFENLIWEPPRRSFAYIKLPENNTNTEGGGNRRFKVEIGFNNDLVYLASYQTGNFYQYQLPRRRSSVVSFSDEEKREECLLVGQYSLL
ncbi:uncharacterized protein J8A68_003493 [[Candida] subhashii]|uniref:Autophagy-related protein 21 n=1 Tax=[Candida] subhashii TaxID=561895 RepID=A0A8J5QJ07_9ASCO|nr:uncharacterized protein J8A68_003493 [[Candida] subhashii]KAG7662983.1 hypothetical protein J8A68_003493 [[Candida] subhashii]